MQTLRVERLSQGVVNELLGAIRIGQFKPGERLPSERQLAEDFGVSRASVREGLRILELMETIEVRQGRGAVVLAATRQPSGQLLRRWLDSHQSEVVELLEVREALESAAAALAASREASEIHPVLEASDELDAIVNADVEFHKLVADRSGNDVLAGLVDELNGVLEASRYAMFAISGRRERSHRDHLSIARAINKRKPVEAAAAMRRHIANTMKEIEMQARRSS
jgi:GntR family transcriptional repressor for pyruvate dehydrogenase complex